MNEKVEHCTSNCAKEQHSALLQRSNEIDDGLTESQLREALKILNQAHEETQRQLKDKKQRSRNFGKIESLLEELPSALKASMIELIKTEKTDIKIGSSTQKLNP